MTRLVNRWLVYEIIQFRFMLHNNKLLSNIVICSSTFNYAFQGAPTHKNVLFVFQLHPLFIVFKAYCMHRVWNIIGKIVIPKCIHKLEGLFSFVLHSLHFLPLKNPKESRSKFILRSGTFWKNATVKNEQFFFHHQR